MPPDIPADIDSSQYQSIWDMVSESIEQYAEHPAYYHLEKTISYQQLDQYSEQFAAHLQNTYNVEKGDRIALMVPNILAHPIAMFGILRAGAIVVNINPLFTARELELQLTDSGTRIIIVISNFTDALSKIINKTAIEHVINTEIGDFHSPFRRWLINNYTRYIKGLKPAPGLASRPLIECINKTEPPLQTVDIQQDDIAYLQYTGGTTGSTKAAMLTHGNIIANALQANACISLAFDFKNPHVITALPLYHIFALTANCFVVIRLGGCSHLITNPRDMDSFIGELKKVQISAITGVNTLFSAMLKHPEFKKVDFSALRLTLAGGMSVQPTTAKAWHKATGSPIVEAYGLTESSPAITANSVHIKSFTGHIGFPLPSTEVSIRDDDGMPLPVNTAGELWARGPQVMKGYWNNPDETRLVLTDDGWLKTGDIATMSEHGEIQIVDRKKDMIIISGFNAYPNEIETILTNHPDIDEAGVIGVEDENTGEAIKAVIVKHRQSLTKEEIIDHCRKYLAAYKIPKIIEFRDELPKSNIGKVLRRSLK